MMNKKWQDRSLEESINTCFEHFLYYSSKPNPVTKFISEIKKAHESHNMLPNFPYKIFWKLTNKCNLRCKHCFYLKTDFFENNDEELTTEQIFKIIDELHEITVFSVMLTGGEVLARKDFFDILKYLKKRNVHINILTNATMMNEDIISKLKNTLNKYTDELLISVDGTKEIHEETRGKGTYDKTITAIKNLIDEGFMVDVNYTTTSKNINVLPEVFKTCGELGVNKFRHARFLIFYNNAEQQCLQPDERLLFKAEAEIISLLKDYPNMMYQSFLIQFPVFYKFVEFLPYLNPEYKKAVYNKKLNQKNILCHNHDSCHINAKGQLFPCSQCELSNDNYFLMGDLKKESFKDIWSRRSDNLIFKERNLDDIEGCSDCKFNCFCQGSCPAWTYFKQKSVYKPPAECNVWKCGV